MFSNRFYGKRSALNWSRAFTADGARRIAFVRQIHALRHQLSALACGELEWLENDAPESLISYVRGTDEKKILVLVNGKNKAVTSRLNPGMEIKEVLLSEGVQTNGQNAEIAPYGYLLARI